MESKLNNSFADILEPIRERHKIIHAELVRFDDVEVNKVEWITINGTHVPIDENGTALAGGKLAGKSFNKIRAGTSPGGASASLSKDVSPKRTDYDFSAETDSVQEFVHKNVDKLTDIYDSGGMSAVKDEFYRYRMADTSKGLHEISSYTAQDVLYDNIPQGIKDGWMREANSGYKPKLILGVTKNQQARNAALNVMYQNYKYSHPEDNMPFDTFLKTPVTMYRGGHGQSHTNDDIFSSYSFDKKVAEKFAGNGGKIYTASIRPIDTYGSISENGESEIFVPTAIAPNKNRDSQDVIT